MLILFLAGLILTLILMSLPLYRFSASVYSKKSSNTFVGDEKYCLGNIFDGVKNTEVQDGFRKCNAYAREECSDCWARLYCSGGCAANAYHATGSINGVYKQGCELFKKRIECAVMMQVAEAEE
jgi:uncharacterized protein